MSKSLPVLDGTVETYLLGCVATDLRHSPVAALSHIRHPVEGLPILGHVKTFRMVGLGAWPLVVISSLGGASQRGVVRLCVPVSNVLGRGQGLTSSWVPLGSVRARSSGDGIFVVYRYTGPSSTWWIGARLLCGDG